MNLKITARHPRNQVKDLVNLAYTFVFDGALVRPPDFFKVWVKNSEYAHAGRFFGHKISLRIGPAKRFPSTYQYPGLKSAPSYVLNDWQEALFVVAVHEFWHYYQMKTSSPYSEIETEKRCVVALEKFRAEMRPELNIRWNVHTEKQSLREQTREQKAAQKRTPQFELQQLQGRISKSVRRIKLYQTKLKKMLRRERHLQKKIAGLLSIAA